MSYRSDEEQLDALKQWWKKNGTGLVVGVVLAGAAVFGWRGWQSYQQTSREAASSLYQSFLEATNQEADGDVEARVTLEFVANQLKNEFPGSAYASYASFSLAREAVGEDDLESAEAELRWILASSVTDTLKDVARLRLARVLAGRESYAEALDLLDRVRGTGHQGPVDEVRGDIFLEQGRIDEARDAYGRALEADPNTISGNIVTIKLADLGEAPVPGESPASLPRQ